MQETSHPPRDFEVVLKGIGCEHQDVRAGLDSGLVHRPSGISGPHHGIAADGWFRIHRVVPELARPLSSLRAAGGAGPYTPQEPAFVNSSGGRPADLIAPLIPPHDEDPHWRLRKDHVCASLQMPAKSGELQIIHVAVGMDWDPFLARAGAEQLLADRVGEYRVRPPTDDEAVVIV